MRSQVWVRVVDLKVGAKSRFRVRVVHASSGVEQFISFAKLGGVSHVGLSPSWIRQVRFLDLTWRRWKSTHSHRSSRTRPKRPVDTVIHSLLQDFISPNLSVSTPKGGLLGLTEQQRPNLVGDTSLLLLSCLRCASFPVLSRAWQALFIPVKFNVWNDPS